MAPAPASPTEEARPTVSIVLATLNERDNLPRLLERILRQPLPPFEVIVVDDGSTDGTREFVRELGQEERRVRALFHDGKQTTLCAQRQGIEAARGEFVVVMDADLQHPPELILEMVRELRAGAGVVVASRYARGGTPGPRTAYRALISRGAEWVAKLLLRGARGVTDPVSGFFGFRREVFRSLNPLYRGYKLLLFVLVMNEGRPVAEVGFRFETRRHGASKVTETSQFILVFLIEALLARRLEGALRGDPPPGARLPQAPGESARPDVRADARGCRPATGWRRKRL